jgi:hypothetical protein
MQYAAVAASAIGAVSWIGHLAGRESLYTWTRLGIASGEGAMSRPSATVAILTGVSLFILAQKEYKRIASRTDAGGRPGAGRGARAAGVSGRKRAHKNRAV